MLGLQRVGTAGQMLRRSGQRKVQELPGCLFFSGEEQALKDVSIVKLRDEICSLKAKFN